MGVHGTCEAKGGRLPLINVTIETKSAATALTRIADLLERLLANLGVPLIDALPPTEPTSAAALAEEITYDTDEDRKRRELSRLAARGDEDELASLADDQVTYPDV